MSGNDNKDNSTFEFIKEQVIEKKRRKLRKRLMPIAITILLAILFGLIASVTFVLAEPKLNKLLNKGEETNTPFSFPTPTPEANGTGTEGNSVTTNATTGTTDVDGPDSGMTNEDTTSSVGPTPTPIIVEKSIAANLDDFTSMYDEMRKLTYETNKSLVEVVSTYNVTVPLFDTSAEQTISTSGLIVASYETNYLILVSFDRVKGANSIKIKFSDASYADTVIQNYDAELNIALLAVKKDDIPLLYKTGLQPVSTGESNSLMVGSPVIASGNPNGYIHSMEIGMITSKGSYARITDNQMELFNTDMDFSKNSDGFIINLKGKVIGWITRTVIDENNPGLSTAISISKLMPVINQMANQEPRIYFGIIADDLASDVKQAHNIANGIFVSDIQDDSPAYEAGLKKGDFILSIDDQTIVSTTYFYDTIAKHKAGDKVNVKIQRSAGNVQKEMDLPVTLKNKIQ